MGIPSYMTPEGAKSRVTAQNVLSAHRNARNREIRQASNAASVDGLQSSATATDQTAAAESPLPFTSLQEPSTVPAAAQLPCGPAVSAGPWTYQQYNSNAVLNPPVEITSGAASLAGRLQTPGGNNVPARSTGALEVSFPVCSSGDANVAVRIGYYTACLNAHLAAATTAAAYRPFAPVADAVADAAVAAFRCTCVCCTTDVDAAVTCMTTALEAWTAARCAVKRFRPGEGAAAVAALWQKTAWHVNLAFAAISAAATVLGIPQTSSTGAAAADTPAAPASGPSQQLNAAPHAAMRGQGEAADPLSPSLATGPAPGPTAVSARAVATHVNSPTAHLPPRANLQQCQAAAGQQETQLQRQNSTAAGLSYLRKNSISDPGACATSSTPADVLDSSFMLAAAAANQQLPLAAPELHTIPGMRKVTFGRLLQQNQQQLLQLAGRSIPSSLAPGGTIPKPVASQVGTSTTDQPAVLHAKTSQPVHSAAVNAAAGPLYGMPLSAAADPGGTPGLATSCRMAVASAVGVSVPSARPSAPKTPAPAPKAHPVNTVIATAHPGAAGAQPAAAAAAAAPTANPAHITPTPTGAVKVTKAANTKHPPGLSCSGVLGSHAGTSSLDPTAKQAINTGHINDNELTNIEDLRVWDNIDDANIDDAQRNLRPRPQLSPPGASDLVYSRSLQNSPPGLYYAHAAEVGDTADSAQGRSGSGPAQSHDNSIGIGRDSINQARGLVNPGAGDDDRVSAIEDMDMPSEHPPSAATVAAAGQAVEQPGHDGQCEATNLGPALSEESAECDPGVSFAGDEGLGSAYLFEDCICVQYDEHAVDGLLDGLRSATNLARANPRRLRTLSAAAAAASSEQTMPLQAAKRAAECMNAAPCSSHAFSKRQR